MERHFGINTSEAPERAMRISDVLAMIRCGKSKLYEEISAKRFPRPFYIGRNSPRWLLSDVLLYLDHLSEQRSTPERL